MKKILITFYLLIISFAMYGQDERYEEWYLQTDDSLDIYVREIINHSPLQKDTVIVVHGGFGANHDYMLDAIKGLENDYHFVLYDQRGSLLSPAPIEKLSFEKNVNDLNLLIEELNLSSATLMCHSMGTLVGMEYLRRFPGKVKNIVLIGAIFPKSTQVDDVFSKRYNEQIEFLKNRAEVKALLKPYEMNKDSLTDKERTQFWRIKFAYANMYQVSKWRILKGGWAYFNPESSIMGDQVNWNYDYREILNNIESVTYIQGDYDFLDFNAEKLNELIVGFSNISMNLIENSGHQIWLDEPDLFRFYLKKALDKKPAANKG